MANLKKSPPWIIYYKELQTFFEKDSEVKVIYDNDNYEVKLYVDNVEKADALSKLLNNEKVFGNITLKITVIPSNILAHRTITNNKEKQKTESIFSIALSGNHALSYIHTIDIFSNSISYIVFINKVVQFYTDDLGDINGLRSTLYQDIARDIFRQLDGVFYCTSTETASITTTGKIGSWTIGV